MRAAIVLTSILLFAGCRTQRFEDGAGKTTTKRTSFRGQPATNLAESCVEDYQPGVDYFPDKISLQHARIFSVSYHEHYKIVKLAVERTLSAGEKVSDTMVLVQCGAPAPPLTGELAGATVITIPVMSIASNDNCDIAAVSQLGFDDRLMAIGGGHIYNKTVRKRWESRELATIGYAWHGLPNSEVLLAQPPDVLFMRRATLEQGRSLARARNLGIRAAPTLARHEQHYLGYAEWIKYFAVFLNAERIAQDSFLQVAQRCERLMQKAKSATPKPSVFWASYSAGGNAVEPGG
jgi:iron complex transport system substrate-binding protein